jgi:hypothetical protein
VRRINSNVRNEEILKGKRGGVEKEGKESRVRKGKDRRKGLGWLE